MALADYRTKAGTVDRVSRALNKQTDISFAKRPNISCTTLTGARRAEQKAKTARLTHS